MMAYFEEAESVHAKTVEAERQRKEQVRLMREEAEREKEEAK
jgi:hypothetical protein